jgi:hypothetical protein
MDTSSSRIQSGSNHHANAEMIDKAGVLVLDKGSVPENLADSGRTFHSWGIDGGLISM